MGVECASCGQIIPPGQFRCGNCGTVQARDSIDDYAGLTELTASGEPLRAPGPAASSFRSGAEEPRPATPSEPQLRPVTPPHPPPPPPPPPMDDDDSGVREPQVPRGTFASVVPDRASDGDDRERVRPAPERDPSSNRPPAAAPQPNNSTSQRIKSVRPPVRPPYLASEILREDLTPSEPGRRHMNVVLQVGPALGALAVLSSGIDRAATWVSLGVLALLFILTRFDLHYKTLSLLVVGIGATGLAVTSGWRLLLGGAHDGPLLAATVTLLAAALLFRTWYRAAYTARVLVALALVLALTWATWTSHRELLALEFDWQSWLPALAWYVFGILCLLSLLAFMGDETTGGCHAWAAGVSIWFGLYAALRSALEHGAGSALGTARGAALGLSEAVLAGALAVALAQIVARAFVTRSRVIPRAS